jgi:hypothetical protein
MGRTLYPILEDAYQKRTPNPLEPSGTMLTPYPAPNQMEAAPFAVASPPCDVAASAPGPKIPQEGSEVTSSVHQHRCQHMFKVILILEPWVKKTPQTSEKKHRN